MRERGAAMLTKRVIPCLDVKDGRVVKGVNFVNLRDAGDPVELASRYDREGADEVVFLDITATAEGRKTTIEMASRASEQLHIPFTVGGGFTDVDSIRTMISAGADKVSVNSAAVRDPELITRASDAFGSQAIICAIDAKAVDGQPGRWTVFVKGGREDTGLDAVEWACEAARRGAGEILLTSMDRDGSKAGFDTLLTCTIAQAVDIPVIASGGVGELRHFSEGIIDGQADAVLAASVFHFGELSIREVKADMAAHGIPVRPVEEAGMHVAPDACLSRRAAGSGSMPWASIDEVSFDDRGLVPAVVQDASNGDVLMMAWMNRESLLLTMQTGRTWFWSRSRQQLWNKGESSGNFQNVVDIRLDCDGDTLLVLVDPAGPACHTGNRSCFHRRLK